MEELGLPWGEGQPCGMWPTYSKRLSGRVFPRHVLGLGIVTSIIPAEAPLCCVWEPVQAPLWSRSHIGCPEKGWKRQGLFSGLSRPSTIVMSPVPLFIVSAFVLGIWW